MVAAAVADGVVSGVVDLDGSDPVGDLMAVVAAAGDES